MEIFIVGMVTGAGLAIAAFSVVAGLHKIRRQIRMERRTKTTRNPISFK